MHSAICGFSRGGVFLSKSWFDARDIALAGVCAGGVSELFCVRFFHATALCFAGARTQGLSWLAGVSLKWCFFSRNDATAVLIGMADYYG